VRKYDTPPRGSDPHAIPGGAEGLQSGTKVEPARGFTAALPFYQRATDLDPSVSHRPTAGCRISTTASSKGGGRPEYARKAYAAAEKVSERERFNIEGRYYLFGTGELEKAATTFELYQQTYQETTSLTETWDSFSAAWETGKRH